MAGETTSKVGTIPVVVMVLVFLAQGWLMWEMNRELVDGVKKSIVPVVSIVETHAKESKTVHAKQDRQTDQLIQTLRMNTFLANCVNGHILSKKIAGPCEALSMQITNYGKEPSEEK